MILFIVLQYKYSDDGFSNSSVVMIPLEVHRSGWMDGEWVCVKVINVIYIYLGK